MEFSVWYTFCRVLYIFVEGWDIVKGFGFGFFGVGSFEFLLFC